MAAILFYAPWCFYSQQMMPAWDLAHQKMQLHEPPVPLARIDASRYGNIGDKYGVSAFPTMKLFVDGNVFDYDPHQGRGWQQIVKWVNRHIDRDHILSKVDDIEHYLHDNELNVVGLYPDGYNSTVFGASARHFDDVIFAEARGSEVSRGIADKLAVHATLTCETMTVGQSREGKKAVTLPRADMKCSDSPRNPQRPEWSDSFKVEVQGAEMTVTRADSRDGWQQNLQIKCCDDESHPSGEQKQLVKIDVPSIVMFMPHDERFAVYDGDLEDTHALDKWITGRRTPMIMSLNDQTAEKLLAGGSTPVVFLIRKEGSSSEVEGVLREAAKQLRGRIIVCFSGLSTPIEKRFGEVAGVDESALPVVTLIEAHAGSGGPFHTSKKFRLSTAGLTVQGVVQFVDDYEGKRLKPWLRSEPAPSAEDQFDGGVGIVVGSTFVEVAQDPSVDVLIDFYAPWCGHCRKFEPHYKELARKLKHVSSLRIMKVDATRNELEGMSIMGFPTIVLFPAGPSPKHQVYYQGSRQPDDMVRWLKDHCSLKFDDRPPKQEKVEDPVESGLLDPSEEDL